MRVLEPKVLEKRREDRSKKHKTTRRKHGARFFILLILATYVAAVLLVSVPQLQATINPVKAQAGTPVSLSWPTYGQAAVGAVGYGLLDQHGDQKKVPIASVAKVMTAIAVLKVKPMHPGEDGEMLTMTREDEAVYERYIAEGQSVVKVEAGEELTQYQALQALMLPSANNMAEVLARWAFGSIEDYLTFVNPFTKTLGLDNTTIADASGYNPGTQSTAVDLTKLAEIAMNHPVLAEIVGQAQAELPSAGTVYNVNNFLGSHGIVGVKTGNTDEAGGCYMFAARRQIETGETITVVGVVMGGYNRAQAMDDSLPLIDEVFKGFRSSKPVETGQVVGSISQSGGNEVPVKVRQGLRVVTWAANAPRVEVTPHDLGRQIKAGEEVGTITVLVGNLRYTAPVVAGGDIKGRSVLWRLTHAGGYL